ncbi:MAG: cob(I)yrinic acid a,c-diamide adenosyltransferase [Candidatus Omnitrophota bacterium]|jgi:cob(I)alamin adenosyltransferase|nr:MAG: cob(I)yrinic acid a,c-diamide adenosyltransferase [Candidatus Omnitrophota bacterium]
MIQVYTGNGKGKTTAALGLALRASGAGKKVYFCQFLKGRACSEIKALKKHKNIKVEQFGSRCFVCRQPSQKDIDFTKKGIDAVKKAVNKKCYDVIILDEINVAINLGLIRITDVLSCINNVPKDCEIILTGRYAHPKIIKAADLVSEIREVKHYYSKGKKARRGIEY